MSSIEANINHDHIYLSNINVQEQFNQKDHDRRIIRKKTDIQTDEDREEYLRRRTLNNVSCRISRIHRRSKLDLMIKKCLEYEHSNTKLTTKQSILIEVIDQLKEHLRSLVPHTIEENWSDISRQFRFDFLWRTKRMHNQIGQSVNLSRGRRAHIDSVTTPSILSSFF